MIASFFPDVNQADIFANETEDFLPHEIIVYHHVTFSETFDRP